MDLPQLPLEVLSHIVSLVTPPFHPSEDTSENSALLTPPKYLIDTLDPQLGPSFTPLNTISATCKASHSLLEAARPWLWENVDVRSGRGWLGIVNALTEEVIGDIAEAELDAHKPDAVLPTQPVGAPSTPVSPVTDYRPLHGSDTNPPVQLNPIPGGFHRYISPANHIAQQYPSPYPVASTASVNTPIGIRIPAQAFDYSPPQPSQPSQLLTPPGSRGSSPHVALPARELSLPTNFSPTPLVNPPGSASSSKASSVARLRGRSRSPRRSVGFEAPNISDVLDRSRSVEQKGLGRAESPGGSWPRRMPFARRRSSLSRARTISDNGYDEDDEAEEDEEEDKVAPLLTLDRDRSSSRHPLTPPPLNERPSVVDSTDSALTELLPPPGPYIRHLSFNNFRTIGSRRTQDEAVRGRYVTAGRLEGVIKNCPNLISLCMTEYVDSSLSFPVLEDILFRGYKRPRKPRRLSTANPLTRQRSLSVDPNLASPLTTISQLDPPRPEYVPYEDENEDDKWKRRGMFTAIQALDLTGCVSGVFTKAMVEFWSQWLDPEHDESDDERGRSRTRGRYVIPDPPSSTEDDDEDDLYERQTRIGSKRTPRFPAMKRLSLRACTTLEPAVLYNLVLAFPSLTHLDLSNTRLTTSLLSALTESPPKNMRLKSLSLARCTRLDPTALVDFLVLSPVASELTELNLYMNPTQANTITTSDLDRLLTAPCIKSGRLRYLDLSSAGITPDHLAAFPAQPSLLSLGLSHIPTLPLRPIADFLLGAAPNVEILTLTGTSITSLNPALSSLQVTLELHAHLINPLTTVPFSFANLSLNSSASGPDLRPGATRLRVIELSAPVRRLIADGGSGEWKVVKSKGGRGWYVDLSAGWIPESAVEEREDGEKEMRFVRHLPNSHPRRQFLASLAAANGRVGSAIGWHSRKMEVIRGMGMLGREEGMAGVGGFAFEE